MMAPDHGPSSSNPNRLEHLAKKCQSLVRVYPSALNPLRRLTIALALFGFATSAPAQEPLDPLKPLDRSSPRATLKTFLDAGDALGVYLARDYLPSPSRNKFHHLLSLGDKVTQNLDLSEVPPAARTKTGRAAAAALYATLNRIPLPPFDKIPDATELSKLSSGKPERWVIPNTEIAIERQKSGPNSGQLTEIAGLIDRGVLKASLAALRLAGFESGCRASHARFRPVFPTIQSWGIGAGTIRRTVPTGLFRIGALTMLARNRNWSFTRAIWHNAIPRRSQK